MKCPVKSSAEICLGYLTGQLHQLGIREVLPQFGKQFVADFSRSARHGNGKIKNELLNRAEYAVFLIVREISEFLLGNTGCPALGRA
jgi:hypothetical protein